MVSNTIQCGFESHPGHTSNVGDIGFSGRMYGTTTRLEAAHLRGLGHSLSDVSRSLGVSRSTLRSWEASGGGGLKPTDCPACDGAALDAPAYAALLGYYLGDGCVSRAARCFTLRISCDARQDTVIDHVGTCMKTVRDGAVFHVRAAGCIVVQAHWVH